MLALNADLIEMLMTMRDQIDEKLDELDAIEEDEEEVSDDEEDVERTSARPDARASQSPCSSSMTS